MDVKVTIIGAGVVGLAIGKVLSEQYQSVYIIERNKKFGQETSSRNSEVIHSGIYYPIGSLKANLCVEGAKMLINYCNKKNVDFRQCGKYIVATTVEESIVLPSILAHALKCGVDKAKIISSNELKEVEPNVNAVSAIYFPTTGIIDSHGLMKQYETDNLLNGAQIVYGSKVVGLQKINQGYEVTLLDSDSKRYTFTSEVVINSAGLESQTISNLLGINEPRYSLYYWKGEYFSVHNGKNRFVNSLIYPVPNHNLTGLGVHATIDLGGGLKLGPNAIFLKNNEIDYSVNNKHRYEFYQSAKKMLPFLEEEDLQPDQAGIRPKLQKPGDPVRDFIISNETEKGLKNFINLIGIESPGLTASLAIAEYVKNCIV